MNLILTDAGRGAVADGMNQGTNQVNITDLAIGDGRAPAGADDSARAALRNERLRADAGGSTTVDDRFAFRATFVETDPAWDVTEAGLFARTGGVGAKFLFAYFSVGPAPADPIARITPNAGLELAGAVQVVASPAAVAATIDAALTIMGPDALLSLDLRAYGPGTNENLVAPARPRRWLVVALGGGGGGSNDGSAGTAGGDASLTGTDVAVTANGGAAGATAVGNAPAVGTASVTGSRATGQGLAGSGAPGGTPIGKASTHQGGAPGGLAVALVTPDPGESYAVSVAAGGAGGGAAGLFVLEFLPTG